MTRPPTPAFIAAILESDWFWLATRIIAAFMFWITGVQWLTNFAGAIASANMVGLSPPNVWGGVIIAFYLLGSVMIVLDRWLWLAAGAFGVFTLLTIILVHHWWNMDAAAAADNWRVAKEHITVIGGMMALALASHLRGGWRGQSVR